MKHIMKLMATPSDLIKGWRDMFFTLEKLTYKMYNDSIVFPPHHQNAGKVLRIFYSFGGVDSDSLHRNDGV